MFAPSSWLILDAKGLQLQTFCVATLTPRGDPLSASLRALVGEGCEGYPPNGLLILVPQNASPAQRGPRREFKGKEAKYFVAVISPLERLSEATREARCL